MVGNGLQVGDGDNNERCLEMDGIGLLWWMLDGVWHASLMAAMSDFGQVATMTIGRQVMIGWRR